MAKQVKPSVSILTPQDYDAIMQAEQRIEMIEAGIAQVEQCGVDCQDHRNNLAWAREQLAKIKSTMFPHGRPR